MRRDGPRQEEVQLTRRVGSSGTSPPHPVTTDLAEHGIRAPGAVAIGDAFGPVRVVLWADGGVPTVAPAAALMRYERLSYM